MSVRAIIFDVYKTILDVAPPPADREERWLAFAREWLGATPRLGLRELIAACETIIAREHAKARALGIAKPEIFWPDVMAEMLPEISHWPAARRDDFLWQQQALFHTVALMPGAAAVLRTLHERGVPLGIASNAQAYTLRELERALAPEGLGLSLFAPDLCFWSFAHGFSKPDPHVFRLLTARLHLRGVRPEQALMVGDRLDNDIAPARAAGWQTWRLVPVAEEGAGDWRALAEFVSERAGRD